MSKSCLGLTLDIHGGGPDLPFPHHENEIAQSEAANGCQYAHYWMHAGAVRVNDEKCLNPSAIFYDSRGIEPLPPGGGALLVVKQPLPQCD